MDEPPLTVRTKNLILLQSATQQNCLRFSNPPDGTTYLLLVNGRVERRLCKKPQYYEKREESMCVELRLSGTLALKM
ncbi:hypothetical protein AVEN_211710-1, partial [Araneus ventricosus]